MATQDTSKITKLLETQGGVHMLDKPFVSPHTSYGVLENLGRYSDDLTAGDWTISASVTLAANNVAGPDGTVDVADKATAVGSSQTITYAVNGLATSASKKVTVGLWFYNFGSASVSSMQIISTNEESDKEFFDITSANERTWFYKKLSWEFTAASTGAVSVRFNLGQNQILSIHGINVSETDDSIGYIPTNGTAEPNRRGLSVNDQFYMTSTKSASKMEIRKGGVQSTTDLFKITDTDGTDKVMIDSAFTLTQKGLIEAINTTAKTGAYTAISSDDNILCDTSSGAFTITLPAAPEDGRVHTVILETAGNILTVSGNGNNILGSASVTLSSADDAIQLIYNGTQWSLK